MRYHFNCREYATKYLILLNETILYAVIRFFFYDDRTEQNKHLITSFELCFSLRRLRVLYAIM